MGQVGANQLASQIKFTRPASTNHALHSWATPTVPRRPPTPTESTRNNVASSLTAAFYSTHMRSANPSSTGFAMFARHRRILTGSITDSLRNMPGMKALRS